ncbi:MAG: ester cyclase [Chloroflexota bacterium]
MTDDHTDLLRSYVADVWGKKDVDALDHYLTEGYRRHLTTRSEPLDREGQKRLVASFWHAFPDAELEIQDVLVEGDRLAFRSIMRGTHRGTFHHIPATGRNVEVYLLDFLRIEDGRFAEQWGGPNLLDLLQQVGASVGSRPDRRPQRDNSG